MVGAPNVGGCEEVPVPKVGNEVAPKEGATEVPKVDAVVVVAVTSLNDAFDVPVAPKVGAERPVPKAAVFEWPKAGAPKAGGALGVEVPKLNPVPLLAAPVVGNPNPAINVIKLLPFLRA